MAVRVKFTFFFQKNQILAFCMAKHPRLGISSPAKTLPKDVMKLIFSLVPNEKDEEGNGY